DTYQRFVAESRRGTNGNPTILSRAGAVFRRLPQTPLGTDSYAFNLLLSVVRRARAAPVMPAVESKPNFRYQVVFPHGVVLFNPRNVDTDEVSYAWRLQRRELDLTVFDDALRRFVEFARRYDFVPIVSYTPSAHAAYRQIAVFDDAELGSVI